MFLVQGKPSGSPSIHSNLLADHSVCLLTLRMFQEESISISDLVTAIHNAAKEQKMKKGSWLPAAIEDLFSFSQKVQKKMNQQRRKGKECF